MTNLCLTSLFVRVEVGHHHVGIALLLGCNPYGRLGLIYMSKKHSIASKRRWADVPADERSKIMSARIKARWARMTPYAKKKQLSLMRQGLVSKQNKNE